MLSGFYRARLFTSMVLNSVHILVLQEYWSLAESRIPLESCSTSKECDLLQGCSQVGNRL